MYAESERVHHACLSLNAGYYPKPFNPEQSNFNFYLGREVVTRPIYIWFVKF